MNKRVYCLALSCLMLGACGGDNGSEKQVGPEEEAGRDSTDATETTTDATDEPGDKTDDSGDEKTDHDPEEEDEADTDGLPADYSDTRISWRGTTGTVKVNKGDSDNLRSFTLETTASLRWIGDDHNNVPAQSKDIVERKGEMRLFSGHSYFDALWALAIDEAKQDSVSSLSNWAFGGNSIPCDCFDTGENWNYVWTRDTSYSMDLGLALMDPERAMNSLLFKVSDRKSGGAPQIIQDTGSGGSWPISTDRVIWSLGAYETMKFLPQGTTREEFIERSYAAISNTLEADRLAIYSADDGLYTGEQSYLDWRENTYQPWVHDDVVHIGMSKSFSTNTAHYITMQVAAALGNELYASTGNKDYLTAANKYADWAVALQQAMVQKFYNKDNGLFYSMTGTYLDDGPQANYDALGHDLAILWGVINGEQAQNVMANYPLVEAGPPVIWPQQPKTRIYHNRSIWPFVTAYHLRAALKAGNAQAVDNAFNSLVRGAAFNLSNMENFEFTTLQSWYVDNSQDYLGRELSGPNINSRRQLWSVGGYLSAVLYGIFGLEADLDTIWFNPRITANIRNTFLAGSDKIELRDFQYRGKKINITINLPARTKATDGFFAMESLQLNGVSRTQAFGVADLDDTNEIVINMQAKASGTSKVTIKNCQEDAECFAPQMPSIPTDPYGIAVVNGKLQITFTTPDKVAADLGNTYNIYRDGELLAQNVQSPYTDTTSSDYGTTSHCYSVTAVNKYGNESHHAEPLCYWGENYVRADGMKYAADKFDGTPNASDHNRTHFADWGKPEDSISVSNITPSQSGSYLLTLEYGNGRKIDGGITCAVKTITVTDSSGNVVASDVVMMPHLGADNWDRWGESSFMPVELEAGKSYTVTISDYFNMSYFDHFLTYTDGAGGGSDVYNRINLSTVKFLLMNNK